MMSDSFVHVRFGGFELDEAAFELRQADGVVPIEPQPLTLLLMLVRHRDRVMRREELTQALWPDTAVGSTSLPQAIRKVRDALGESGGERGAIQTHRGLGFRFVAEVEEEPEAPLRAQPRRRRGEPGLYGREADCEAVLEALDGAIAGRGSATFVTGAAGIGKTRLAAFAAEAARHSDTETHRAGALEERGAPPFWLWVQILRSYADTLSEGELADAPGSAALDLARLVPDLSPDAAPESTGPADSDEARFRLFDALVRFLVWRSRERPQVLVLEDLHWADPASLAALGHLAGELSEHAIAIVATFRDDELGPGHAILDIEAECARHDALRRISLGGLAPGDVTRLVTDLAGFTPSDSLTQTIVQRTGGNPFFIKQIVSLDVEAARTSDDPERQLDVTLATMPREVRRVVGRRLGRLSEDARTVLAAGAVLGRSFDVATVLRMVPLAREALLQALQEAGDSRAIQPVEGTEHRYAFLHDLLREVVYDELDETARMRLHRAAAEALEDIHPEDRTPVVPALAHHYGCAAPLLDGAEAVDYAKWAGSLAQSSLAYEEAFQFYDRALHAMDLTPEPSIGLRAELMVLRGFALQSCGRHEEGRQALREALHVSRVAGSGTLMVASAVGLAEFGIGLPDAETLDALEQARAALAEPEGMLHVWVYGLLAANLANDRERLPEADSLSKRAETVANEIDDPGALSLALSSQAAVQRLLPSGHPKDRDAIAARSAACAADARDPTAELLARLQRFGALLERGDISEVDAETARIDELLQRLRSPYWGYVRPSLRAMRELLLGHFEESERLALEAYQGTEHPRLNLAAALAGMIASIRYQQGRMGELVPVMGPLVAQNPKLPALRAGAVLALKEAGRLEEAREEIRHIAADGFGAIVGSESWLCALAMLAEVVAELGEREACEDLLAILEPRADQCIIIANGHYSHGPVSLQLGKLATTLAEWDAAESHLEDALERSDRLRSPVWRAQTLASLARLHRTSGDREHARARAAEATAIATELGMTGLTRSLRA